MFRLKSLYIKDYKNIKDQTFDFSSNTGYIALIGLNGSGKSNLLEAFSLIFQGLFYKKAIPFEYEIKYEMGGHIYERKKQSAKRDGTRVKDDDMQYPSSVIACYSGEDLRLWHMAFEDYYMHYFKSAIDGKILTPKLNYINRYCWDIALIALMSSENHDIKSFLNRELDIVDLDDIEVSFEFAENDDNFKEHNALKWIKRIKESCLDSEGNTTLKSFLSYDFPLIANQTKESTLFHYLYLLSQPKNNPLKGNSIDKYITKIRIKNKGVQSSDYSEGHKKLILVECITRILGDKECLLLFDEPDAHVHIENKKKLLEAITAFEGQSILTTHSPVLANMIQREKKENVFLLKEGRNVDTDGINKLSEISGEEIDIISSAVVIGSKHVLVVEGVSDVRCLTKAIEVWSNKDSKYKKLEAIKFMSAGGTGDVKEIFTDVLFPQIDYIEKIVFLFDVDGAGKTGSEKIAKLKKADAYKHIASKIETIYYRDDTSKNFELEDMFPKEAYKHIVDRLHTLETYRDFKTKTTKTSAEIKDFIKEKAVTFKDEWYDDFKPVLDKLMDVFGLN